MKTVMQLRKVGRKYRQQAEEATKQLTEFKEQQASDVTQQQLKAAQVQYSTKIMHLVFVLLHCVVDLLTHILQVYFTATGAIISYDCPSASEITLKDLVEYIIIMNFKNINHKKGKHNKTMCIFDGLYC